MDILQVFKYYHPHVGGIEGHIQRLAEGLVADGHSVSVLTSTPRGRGERTTHEGVDIIRTGSLGELLSVPLAPSFPLRMRQHGMDKDVVHVHLPNPLATMSVLLSGIDPDVLIATYHSDIVKQTTALQFYAPFLRRFLDRVDEIIVTSPRLLENSRFLPDYEEKCTVVPYGIDIEEFDPSREPSLDLPNDDLPIILFVGRLVYYKGLEYLIEAMQSVDAHLVLVGDGRDREELAARARELGVDDRVTFMGELTGDDLHDAYASADVFALPSSAPSEAFAIVQLEAMAHETPIVNTNLPTGVPWVSQDGETGRTVPPRDTGALVEALSDLVDDRETRLAFGRAGRERVEERFTTERMQKDVAAVYDRLVE